MKTKNIFKIGVISAGLLALTACSTMGGGAGAGSAGLAATGLGSQNGIMGMNVSDAILLKAPHNQSYYFDFNKSDIKPKYLASIDAQANYLVRHPSARVLLAGNTDARGSHEYNIALGQRRAMAVANRLEMDGVKQSQINVISYGDMKPVALGHSEQAYAMNRRVDLTYQSL